MLRARAEKLVLACLLGGIWFTGSCFLNPQPEPPGSDSRGTPGYMPASTTGGGPSGSGTGTTGGGVSTGTGSGAGGGGPIDTQDASAADASAPPALEAGSDAAKSDATPALPDGGVDGGGDGSTEAGAEGGDTERSDASVPEAGPLGD